MSKLLNTSSPHLLCLQFLIRSHPHQAVMFSPLYILPHNLSDDDGVYYFDMDPNHPTLIYTDRKSFHISPPFLTKDKSKYVMQHEEDYIPPPEVSLPTESSMRSKGIRSKKIMSQVTMERNERQRELLHDGSTLTSNHVIKIKRSQVKRGDHLEDKKNDKPAGQIKIKKLKIKQLNWHQDHEIKNCPDHGSHRIIWSYSITPNRP